MEQIIRNVQAAIEAQSAEEVETNALVFAGQRTNKDADDGLRGSCGK